jgi:hypothetical protein
MVLIVLWFTADEVINHLAVAALDLKALSRQERILFDFLQ